MGVVIDIRAAVHIKGALICEVKVNALVERNIEQGHLEAPRIEPLGDLWQCCYVITVCPPKIATVMRARR